MDVNSSIHKKTTSAIIKTGHKTPELRFSSVTLQHLCKILLFNPGYIVDFQQTETVPTRQNQPLLCYNFFGDLNNEFWMH